MVFEQLAVVVNSCDKYSETWVPLIKQFRACWPELQVKFYLISEKEKPLDLPGVQLLTLKQDLGWSTNLVKSLPLIQEDYIFLLIDDLFFDRRIDHRFFCDAFARFVAEDGAYLRLHPVPRPDIFHNDLYGRLSKDALYRTSTVLSIWKKQVLLDCLCVGESAWAFEYNGTQRSRVMDDFFCIYQEYISYKNGIVKGKWDRNVLQWLTHDLGYAVHTTKPKMSRKEHLVERLRKFAAKGYYESRRYMRVLKS